MFNKKTVIRTLFLFLFFATLLILCNPVVAETQYTARTWIDSPKEVDISFEKMIVAGWMLSDNKEATLRILIDGKEIPIESITKRKRPDVITAVPGYGGIELNPEPGYAATVDITSFTTGYHILKTQIISGAGEVLTEHERQIYIKSYKARTYTDYPKQDATIEGTNLVVQGWVMSDDLHRKVKIFIDGIEQQILETKTRVRPDVITAVPGYGGLDLNPQPGYASTIDISKIKNGKHTLKVQILSRNNEILTEQTREIFIEKNKARTYIDFPKQGDKVKEKSLVVQGWVMSNDINRNVKIFLNGVEQQILETKTRVRPDVITAVPGYGGLELNPQPGYASIIDISNKPAGTYILKVQIVSGGGEVLTEDSRQIGINNNHTFGIDVSKHNGTIDWQKVKKSGVQFAIIRAGYRGYGQAGTLMQDIKFVENMRGAIAQGIDVGVYFYSQAINEAEAIEEADMTLRIIRENGFANNITLPVVIDTEESSGRADHISTEQRTKAVKAFCERIKQTGFTPMIYSNPYWLDYKLNMSELSQYNLWLAHYTGTNDPLNNPSNYKGNYQIWQYTSTGRIDGINGDVDLNIRRPG